MSEPEIGTVMKNGTICAGISPQTGKMMYLTPEDAPLMAHNPTITYMNAMNRDKAYGHDDWRLPTTDELQVIFENKEKGRLKGTFNEASEKNKPYTPVVGRTAPGWYRGSDWGSNASTKGIFLKDGAQDYILMIQPCSVRYVRDGESPGLPEPTPHATPDSVTALQSQLNKLAQKRKQKLQLP